MQIETVNKRAIDEINRAPDAQCAQREIWVPGYVVTRVISILPHL
jgi:hypothetical protein